MWWLLSFVLTFPGTYRGAPERTGDGDGSVPVNSRIAWDVKVAERLPWPMSPVSAGGVILVGTGDGRLLALTPDGDPVWEATIGSAIAAPPAVEGNLVFVADGSGGVTALELWTGEREWSVRPGSARIVGSPAIVEGMVVYSGLDRIVRALRPADGSVVWETTMGGPAEGAPAVGEGVVVLACLDRKVRAFELDSGELRWEVPIGGKSRSTAAVAEGLAVVGAQDGTLAAFDLRTGVQVWSYSAGGFVDSSPAIHDGQVYVGSTEGGIHAVSLDRGRALWTYDARARVMGSPAVSGGVVFVGATNGVLHAIDPDTGTAVWQTGIGGAIDGTPLLRDGRAYVATSDGRLVAVGEEAYVELADEAVSEEIAADAPMWIGRRVFTGGIEELVIAHFGEQEVQFLLGTKCGLVYSRDRGQTWLPVDGVAGPVYQLLDLGDHGLLVIAQSGLFAPDEIGAWSRFAPLPVGWGSGSRPCLISPRGDVLALGASALLSGDAGRTWRTLELPADPSTAAWHPTKPGTFLLAGTDGNLYRTPDAGQTWELMVPPGETIVLLDICRSAPRRWLALSGAGNLLLSWDEGRTWEIISLGVSDDRPVHAAWDPYGSGNAFLALSRGAVLSTRDGGRSWYRMTYGLPEGVPITGLRFAFGRGGGVALGVELGDGNSGVYRLGKVAQHVRLESVNFDFGSADLKPDAVAQVDEIAERMRREPSLKLRAEGHTDNVGDADANLVLSVRRARSVASLLHRHGVGRERVVFYGFGKSRPIATNDTDEGRARNRRVELYLIHVP